MNNKAFLLVFACFFTLFLASFASAALSFDPTSITRTIDSGQTSLSVNFDLVADNETDYTDIVWEFTSNHGEWTNKPITDSINANDSVSLSATLSSIPSDFSGTITGNININNSEIEVDLPVTITVNAPTWEEDLCLFENDVHENPGDLQVDIRDVNVINDNNFGDDDEWFPFDEVEIEIRVQNDGDEDVDDIELEWGIYNKQTDEWVIDLDEVDTFDLNDNDEDTFTVSFKIDDSDLDVDLDELTDGRDYIIFARAIGEVQNEDRDDSCHADSSEADVIIEDDFVILTNPDFIETISCGTDLRFTADVWNIGDDDQDDVEIEVEIRKLDYLDYVNFDNIDSFDDEKVDLNIPIPEDADEGSYALVFTIYDEDGDVFQNDYDDEDAVFTYVFDVEGSCSVPSDELGAIVAAEVSSGGKVGEQLVINAEITNSGEDTAEFILNADGYREWANSVDINKRTITLDSGDSEQVTFTFDVKKGISGGDKLFQIDVILGTQIVLSQPVSVTLEENASGIPGLGDNWYLWLIGALNIILVIIIIVVAVRVAKK